MPVLGLHHAQVFCPPGGEARAREFSVGRLGLRELPKPASLQAQGGCWFALHPGRHFAVRIDDVARMRRELEAQGVRSEDATEITGWRRCYVFDPFGNKIELDQIG